MKAVAIVFALIGGLSATVEAQEVKTVGVICHCRADFPTYKGFEA